MSVANLKSHITEPEYLAAELANDTKHEFIDGEVYAMAGASGNHERITKNLIIKFGTHLADSPCEPFGSDMKVKIGSRYFYPDVLVDCNFDENDPYFATEPVIIIEVLSEHTHQNDRTVKRLSYINIPTLVEYVLIEQDFVDIEVMRKKDDWKSTHYFLGDNIHFESIDLTLSVEEIYHRVHNDNMIAFLKQKWVFPDNAMEPP